MTNINPPLPLPGFGTLPDGVYFRDARINDKRITGEVTVTAFITTVLNGLVESREILFTALTILEAVSAMTAFLSGLAVLHNVPLSRAAAPAARPDGLQLI